MLSWRLKEASRSTSWLNPGYTLNSFFWSKRLSVVVVLVAKLTRK